MICTAHPLLFMGYKIEKNEMGGVCSAYGRGAYRGFFWGGDVRERDHLEAPGKDWKIILKWLFREWDGGQGLD